MDIIFLSYEEPSAERNFAILQERFPRVKRLHGVNGLGRAHRLTAQMADSDHYFIVDGDNEILPSFNFDAVETPKEENIIFDSLIFLVPVGFHLLATLAAETFG